MRRHWSDRLRRLGACDDALTWARGCPTPKAAWESCPRGDWLLWIAARLSGRRGSVAHRRVVLAACACARRALRFVPADELRPLAAVELAEKWVRRTTGVSRAMSQQAAGAAFASASAAAASAAAAAYAAASAASAASAAAAAAAYAAYAASDAAYAYAAADAAAAKWREQEQIACADTVRSIIKRRPAWGKR